MAKKCRKKSIYQEGGNLQKYAPLAGMAGDVLQSTNSPLGTIGGAMLKGGAAGAALGPWGAAGGVLLGLGQGALQHNQNQEMQDAQAQAMHQQQIQASLANFQNANSGTYREGGNLNQDSTINEYNGLPHELGGIPIGPNGEVEHNETRGIGDTKDEIFSDTLKPGNKGKKTYADISRDIKRKYKGADDEFAREAMGMELYRLKLRQDADRSLNANAESGMNRSYPEAIGNQGFRIGGNIEHDVEIESNNDFQDGGDLNGNQIQPITAQGLPQLDINAGIEQLRQPTGTVGIDDELGKYITNSNRYQLWAPHVKEEALRRFRFTNDARDIRMNKFLATKPNRLEADAYDQILSEEGSAINTRIAQASQNRFNQALRNKEDVIDYPEAVFTSEDQFLENIEGTTAFLPTPVRNRHVNLVRELGFNRQYENKTFDVIRNDKFLKNFGDPKKSISHSDVAFELTPFGSKNNNRAPKRGITFGEFAADPNKYKEALGSNYSTYIDILQKNQDVNQTQDQEDFRMGGRIKYSNGGGIDYLQQQNNLNFIPQQQGIQIDPNQLNNQATPDASFTGQALNPATALNTNNLLGTNQGYNIRPSQYPLKFSTFSTQPGTKFTPDTFKNKLMELGVGESTTNLLMKDNNLGSYYDYIRENAPDEFFTSRNANRNEATSVGSGAHKMGIHHLRSLDADQLRNFLSQNTQVNPVQSLGAQIPNTSDLELLQQSGLGNTGGTGTAGTTTGGTGVGQTGGEGALRGFRPNILEAGLSALPNVGLGLANIGLANNLDFDRVNAQRMQPDFVDPTRALQESRDAFATVKDAARQNASGSGNLMSNLIGLASGQSKSAAGIESQYANQNAQIANQSRQFNAQSMQQANAMNAQIQQQEELDRAALKQQGFTNLASGVNTGIQNYFASKREADMMNISGGENFYYRTVGPRFAPKSVKVFRGNGFHYYEDPDSGKIVRLDPNTGQELNT